MIRHQPAAQTPANERRGFIQNTIKTVPSCPVAGFVLGNATEKEIKTCMGISTDKELWRGYNAPITASNRIWSGFRVKGITRLPGAFYRCGRDRVERRVLVERPDQPPMDTGEAIIEVAGIHAGTQRLFHPVHFLIPFAVQGSVFALEFGSISSTDPVAAYSPTASQCPLRQPGVTGEIHRRQAQYGLPAAQSVTLGIENQARRGQIALGSRHDRAETGPGLQQRLLQTNRAAARTEYPLALRWPRWHRKRCC